MRIDVILSLFMRMGFFICIWVLGFYQSLKWVLITHSNFFDRLIKKFHFCKTVSGVKSKWHGQPFSRVKLTLKPTRSRIWSEVCNSVPRKVPSGWCAQLPLKGFLSLNLELRAKWPEGREGCLHIWEWRRKCLLWASVSHQHGIHSADLYCLSVYSQCSGNSVGPRPRSWMPHSASSRSEHIILTRILCSQHMRLTAAPRELGITNVIMRKIKTRILDLCVEHICETGIFQRGNNETLGRKDVWYQGREALPTWVLKYKAMVCLFNLLLILSMKTYELNQQDHLCSIFSPILDFSPTIFVECLSCNRSAEQGKCPIQDHVAQKPMVQQKDRHVVKYLKYRETNFIIEICEKHGSWRSGVNGFVCRESRTRWSLVEKKD